MKLNYMTIHALPDVGDRLQPQFFSNTREIRANMDDFTGTGTLIASGPGYGEDGPNELGWNNVILPEFEAVYKKMKLLASGKLRNTPSYGVEAMVTAQ